MGFIISISRPRKSWNLSEGHGKSRKSNMLLENVKAKRSNQKQALLSGSRKASLLEEKASSLFHFKS